MAANKSQVVWVQPPSQMIEGLDRYGQKVEAAIVAVAEFLGEKLQGYARTEAKWQDHTGNARSGLFHTVVRDAAKKVVIIYLAHTVDYGIYLELSHGERFAIIFPTIERHLPELKRLLDNIFR